MVKAVAILDGVSSLITEKEFKRIPTVPVISTESTTFDESITVTITAEEDAAIYYTTDGSDPTSMLPSIIQLMVVIRHQAVSYITNH